MILNIAACPQILHINQPLKHHFSTSVVESKKLITFYEYSAVNLIRWNLLSLTINEQSASSLCCNMEKILLGYQAYGFTTHSIVFSSRSDIHKLE